MRRFVCSAFVEMAVLKRDKGKSALGDKAVEAGRETVVAERARFDIDHDHPAGGEGGQHQFEGPEALVTHGQEARRDHEVEAWARIEICNRGGDQAFVAPFRLGLGQHAGERSRPVIRR